MLFLVQSMIIIRIDCLHTPKKNLKIGSYFIENFVFVAECASLLRIIVLYLMFKVYNR